MLTLSQPGRTHYDHWLYLPKKSPDYALEYQYVVLYSCSSTAPNWTLDPTMSKQKSKVRVNFSGLQIEQAKFLVCNYLNKDYKILCHIAIRNNGYPDF